MVSQSSSDLGLGFDDIVAELDREQSKVTVRLETRRFGKPTTLVEGLRLGKEDLQSMTTRMKKKLATGGSVKDNRILLQGDQRLRVQRFLIDAGFRQQSIEVA